MSMPALLRNAYQFAYVTLDLAAAKQAAARLLDITHFFDIETDSMVMHKGEEVPFRINVALANIGGKQLELICPVQGVVDFYFNKVRRDDALMSFHHVGVLVGDGEDGWNAALDSIDTAGYELALMGGKAEFIRYCYADTRADLGHYVEFLGMSAEALAWHRSLPDNPGASLAAIEGLTR